VRRGSITISCIPRALAARIDSTGCWFTKLKVDSDTSGLVPISSITSALENASRPPAQPPRRSKHTHLADWSIVIVE
jgi:hypothetical protein